jgi:hypothetical protein
MLTERIEVIDHIIDCLIDEDISPSDNRWDAIYLRYDLFDNIKKINKELKRLERKQEKELSKNE